MPKGQRGKKETRKPKQEKKVQPATKPSEARSTTPNSAFAFAGAQKKK
jgi:hypothetical protein